MAPLKSCENCGRKDKPREIWPCNKCRWRRRADHSTTGDYWISEPDKDKKDADK